MSTTVSWRRCHVYRSRLSLLRHRSGSTANAEYIPQAVERKWQLVWKEQWEESSHGTNELAPGEEKYYTLSMFPYPSGRLHMGHVRVYTISDAIAQYHRMCGQKVLHPMGWDAFGLPAENAAIDRGIDPASWTRDNISTMRAQMTSLGLHFNWDREVSTCSPDYYKWTQWLFLQLFKRGLAYRKKALVNWDPVDETVLANEQVDAEGRSWRSGALVEKKYLEQWFFKITDYAEPLLSGLESLDWPSSVKAMQRDWIGKSEGAYFDFSLRSTPDHRHLPSPSPLPFLRVFTTRPDTVFGVSFMAISPEHEILHNTELLSENVFREVEKLRQDSVHRDTSDSSGTRSKEGIFSGLYAVHPFTGAGIPVYVADYVLSDYGTKAVMGVPGHDSRDLQFAREHDLPVVEVVSGEGREGDKIINSYQFSGMSVAEGSKSIIDSAHNQGFGGHMIQYKLRDWLISRQRYWGVPIPIVYCDKCGVVPVPESQLPVVLPTGIEFKCRGPSPLTQDAEWLKVDCGKPGCCARREIDTMDTFVDSSWYFLRFIDPHLHSKPFSESVREWMPVDLYVGGIEHAILHLLYARFITHFLHDHGLLSHTEPFMKLLAQGMVQGRTCRVKSSGEYLRPGEREGMEGEDIEESWEKMSKSKYNGVDPEDVVREYGADTVRVFMLFKAPPELDIQWDIQAIHGVLRWLRRVWTLCQDHIAACQEEGGEEGGRDRKDERNVKEDEYKKIAITTTTHQTIKEVTASFQQRYTFNVAVSKLMTLSNTLRDNKDLRGSLEYHCALEAMCLLLAPMAPHITSQLWEDLQGAREMLGLPQLKGGVLTQSWPKYDDSLLQDSSVSMVDFVLQVNGSKRGILSLPADVVAAEDPNQLHSEVVRGALEKRVIREGEEVKRVIIVSHRHIANLVTR